MINMIMLFCLLFNAANFYAQGISTNKFIEIIEQLESNNVSNAESILSSLKLTKIRDLLPYTTESMYYSIDKEYSLIDLSGDKYSFSYKMYINENKVNFIDILLNIKSTNPYIFQNPYLDIKRYVDLNCENCEIQYTYEPKFHENWIFSFMERKKINDVSKRLSLNDNYFLMHYEFKVSNAAFLNVVKEIGAEGVLSLELTLVGDQSGSLESNFIKVPIVNSNGMNNVSIKVSGNNMQFIVDSGASYLTINENQLKYFEEIGFIRPADFQGIVQVKIADGSLRTYQKILIPLVEIGNYKITNIEALITDGDNLLGQSILGRFKNWRIDNAKNQLILEK